MGKRRLVLLVIPCLAASVLLGVAITRSGEPTYQGRSLSAWLTLYMRTSIYDNYTAHEDATHAVRVIGTNAIPFLLKWIRQEPPPWNTRVRKLLPYRFTNTSIGRLVTLGPGQDLAAAAQLGFTLLGTNAEPAIPQLRLLMKDAAHPRTAQRAIIALAALGPPAFTSMAAALTDTNHPNRDAVALLFGSIMPRKVGTNACVPYLRAALSDPDAKVRRIASGALTNLSASSSTNSNGRP